MHAKLFVPSIVWSLLTGLLAGSAEIILPQGRTAFFSREPIEIAVADLATGALAEVKFTAEGAGPVTFTVDGEGTQTLVLPPNALAPGDYAIVLDGQHTKHTLKVRRGIHRSTMYVSQTGGPEKGLANFNVSNAFAFGRLDGRTGLPTEDPRARVSSTLKHYDDAFAEDIPFMIYMYWTGYVLHKPWGIHKEWCSPDMTENMRLFNLHVAQRVRPYAENILYIGSLDEPGLPWGKTASGGSASGFPGWNTEEWYRERGWTFTDDPAGGSDADWLAYMDARCRMLGTQCEQARQDIKTVWPEAVYSTDLYAPHAMMDGTDPWNQMCNDIPSTHVFVDWGYGKLGALSGLYLEKCHAPAAKAAHAMNGQLFSPRVPQPQTRHAYHLMLNSMLAAGLYGNWWLNWNPMGEEDFAAVNGPAERIGPVFAEMAPTDHDVAVLWSWTEIAMRLKDITAKEAKKETGEQIKLMISEYPETRSVEGGLEVNAYSIGGNYKYQVLHAHQAAARAGYPAHIVHERLLPRGVLANYRTLVIVGQTFELPPEVRQAIDTFTANGGNVIMDETTAVSVPGAVVAKLGLQDVGHRWGARFGATRTDNPKMPVEEGLYKTNLYADSFARDATPAMKHALQQTASHAVLDHDSPWLAAERHVLGDCELHMVINTYEELGPKDDDGNYYIYNHAPFEATYALTRLPEGATVYLIEGLDWDRVTRLSDPRTSQTVSFSPGEMKLYLITPKPVVDLAVSATAADGLLRVRAETQRKVLFGHKLLPAVVPLTVSITSPDGEVLLEVYRATTEGVYEEGVSLGRNAPSGSYTVHVVSPIPGLGGGATVDVQPSGIAPFISESSVRVFDETTIRAFLGTKPSLVVPYANDEQKAAATQLADALSKRGLATTARPEAEVWHKALYPRVWDPFIKVYRPVDADKPLPEDVEIVQHLNIESTTYDTPTVTTVDGKPFTGNWREPGTLLTVVGDGYIDISGAEMFYEAGCRLVVDKRRRAQLINGEAAELRSTPDVRERWSRPWSRLMTHVGAFNLVPQLPEAYACGEHLILLGDSQDGELVRALQASELLPRVVDAQYPGDGNALIQFAWSPFSLGKNVIFVGATDSAGLSAGIEGLLALLPRSAESPSHN